MPRAVDVARPVDGRRLVLLLLDQDRPPLELLGDRLVPQVSPLLPPGRPLGLVVVVDLDLGLLGRLPAFQVAGVVCGG